MRRNWQIRLKFIQPQTRNMLDGHNASFDSNSNSQFQQSKKFRMSQRCGALSPTTMSPNPTNFLQTSQDDPYSHRQVEIKKNRPISGQVSPVTRSTDQPIMAAKRRGNGRPQSMASGGLNQSTYVRNPTALSVLQNEIDKGRSTIGQPGPSKRQTNVSSLAKLVSSQDEFEAAFENSVMVDITASQRSRGSKNAAKSCLLTQSHRESNDQRMDSIMEGSRQFFVGEQEFCFDENEGIFWR